MITKQTLLFFFVLFAFTVIQAQPRQSVYTSLEEKRCRTLKSNNAEGGEYLGRCPGTAGYVLLVSEGDLRQNLTVVTPKKTEHSLDLWTVVSSAFSSLGPRAEWRMNKSRPVALIIRYNASENSEKPDKTTSYLVVAKITSSEICITDKISPSPNANELARQLADVSASKPCLKTQD